MTVVDVTGGVLGECCQVTVIASLSILPTATTLKGHEGSPSSTPEGDIYVLLKTALYMF